MAKQAFDHSEFEAGKLRKYQQIGWAAQITLGSGPRSIWLMQAKHIDHSNGSRGIELQIEHYKKDANAIPFTEPEKAFVLKEGAVKVLFEYLQKQNALEGIDLGSDYLAIPIEGRSAGLNPTQKQMLGSVIKNLFGQEDMSELIAQGILSKEVVQSISVAAQHTKYKVALCELESLLGSVSEEHPYQDWFTKHSWVFGTQYTGQIDLRRIGLHEITDMILQTVDGYLDLIELKRPVDEVLAYDSGRKIYYFTSKVSAAIAQCANYMKITEENRHLLKSVENFHFLKPRARIILGRSFDWDDKKKDALRVLNSALHFIEVLTYDQVLAMAQQLIDQYEPSFDQSNTESNIEDEIPF